jgi:hypothetical protein
MQGCDVLVHLAGESIAGARWTPAVKERIRLSRSRGTRVLAEAATKLDPPPQAFVSASAIGFYGDRGAEELTEDSPPGTDFLAEVCQDWEGATEPAQAAGLRVVHLRFGMVLSATGGALPKMMRPFRYGLGGRMGSGTQFCSWVHLGDAVAAVLAAMTDEAYQGPVNVVSPKPVSNAELTRTLARVLGRPAILPLPAFVARLALGEMADPLLFASQRVLPTKLLDTGFSFRFPDLESALRDLLSS